MPNKLELTSKAMQIYKNVKPGKRREALRRARTLAKKMGTRLIGADSMSQAKRELEKRR